MLGTIIRNTGSSYLVRTPEGEEVLCRVKGNLRLHRLRTTNPVAVGDRVEFSQSHDNPLGWITAVCERRNYIVRKATNLSKQSHILAANLDQALLVVTIDSPTTTTTFIDRFLASAEAYGVPTILAINKTDILSDSENLEQAHEWKSLYTSIGYECLFISAETGEGLQDLQKLLQGKQTLLAGHSGVGKSTLVNRLLGHDVARTAPISTIHQTGMHTTTFSEMYTLPGGGYIIDIPGIKGFGTFDFEETQVGHYFREIFSIGKQCRYSNCTHRHEPGCRVLQALQRGEIAQSRYRSYLSILGDENESKYREPY